MPREFAVGGAPHLPPTNSVRRVMLLVLLALVPGIVAATVVYGPAVPAQIGLALVFALALEAAMLRLRQRPVVPFITDGSAAVTAVLFALCLPPWAPWWIALIGMIAAIVLAKQLYGGIGHNVFNPAMVAYAVVLIAFTRELSQWPAPLADSSTWSQSLGAIFGTAPNWDTLAQATPLDTARNLAGQGMTLAEIRTEPTFGAVGGRGSEWIVLAYLIGGVWLLGKRVIDWQVPTGVAFGVLALALPLSLYDPDRHPGPVAQLASGALVFAAFFIATDPVTGAATPRGRLLFGFGVGAITILIRSFGAYPDGVAFAVLLMNLAAPLMDRLTRPRVFGHPR
jgi:electron transport complex protein RnfD